MISGTLLIFSTHGVGSKIQKPDFEALQFFKRGWGYHESSFHPPPLLMKFYPLQVVDNYYSSRDLMLILCIDPHIIINKNIFNLKVSSLQISISCKRFVGNRRNLDLRLSKEHSYKYILITANRSMAPLIMDFVSLAKLPFFPF